MGKIVLVLNILTELFIHLHINVKLHCYEVAVHLRTSNWQDNFEVAAEWREKTILWKRF